MMMLGRWDEGGAWCVAPRALQIGELEQGLCHVFNVLIYMDIY